MAEGPISNPSYISFYNYVRRQPKSKLFFITIKDNSQKTKWITIGKVNDWVRRYSDNYIICRGRLGGLHFHLICYANKSNSFKCPKGIHMNIQQVDKTKQIIPFTDEDKEDILKAKYYGEIRDFRVQTRLQIPIQCLYISSIIKAHFEKRKRRIKRLEARTKYELAIQRVIDYLHKNLLENPEDERLQYISWVERPTHHPGGTPHTSGGV